ncbi:CGNR zinc finger domain-containing protein [Streptomyces sp. NPDC048172]|uniref:CGNR zinc finger domain-containing protein n=1 Tax=Streptomyces sp. NPDC048172 TaxID=3365505 RepID=UPI00371D51CF
MDGHTKGFRPGPRLIDLANALDEDPALPRDALAALLVAHGEAPGDVTEDEFGERDAEALRAAVARLRARVLAEPDTDRAARALNALLAECGARPRLSRHDGHAWHLHVDRADDVSWADWFTAASAHALAQLLSERGRSAWGVCAAEGCARVFLDDGPGTRRRHCSPACASRARVAAHRRRVRAPEDGGPHP